MFEDLLGLASTISSSHNTEPDDIIKTKNALAQTGHYEVSSFGTTPYPDSPMIDGMKNFQKDNGLKVDGVMRPGGPTETALGKQTGSNSSIDPYAPTPKKPKPRPSKVDPLTGLAEIKMPKVAKPKVNPWFKSAEVKPLPDEDHSSNTRAMNGMLQYSKNGSLPGLYANSMKGGDDKAINEFANLLQQLSDRKPERVDGLEREVMAKLPSGVQAKIQNMGVDEEEPKPIQVAVVQQNSPKPSMTHEKVAQLMKGYEENPDKFIRVKQPNTNQTGGDVQVANVVVLGRFLMWLVGFLGLATVEEARKKYDNSSRSKQRYYQREYSKEKDDGDSDRDTCRDEYDAEYGRCSSRPGKWLNDCRDRAAHRRRLCHRNGDVPDPEAPPEWSVRDEEVSRPRR